RVDDLAIARAFLVVAAVEVGHVDVDGLEQTGVAKLACAVREPIGRQRVAFDEAQLVLDQALVRAYRAPYDDLADLEPFGAADLVSRFHTIDAEWNGDVFDLRASTADLEHVVAQPIARAVEVVVAELEATDRRDALGGVRAPRDFSFS